MKFLTKTFKSSPCLTTMSPRRLGPTIIDKFPITFASFLYSFSICLRWVFICKLVFSACTSRFSRSNYAIWNSTFRISVSLRLPSSSSRLMNVFTWSSTKAANFLVSPLYSAWSLNCTPPSKKTLSATLPAVSSLKIATFITPYLCPKFIFISKSDFSLCVVYKFTNPSLSIYLCWAIAAEFPLWDDCKVCSDYKFVLFANWFLF